MHTGSRTLWLALFFLFEKKNFALDVVTTLDNDFDVTDYKKKHVAVFICRRRR